MSERLTSRLAARPDYVVLVGVPLAEPVRWVWASSYTPFEIITPEGRFRAASVRWFVIAYSNLQVLDAVPGRLGIPRELTQLVAGPDLALTRITLAEAIAGRRLVDVRHGPSPARPSARARYRTTLVNVGRDRARVVGFGAFVEVDGDYRLNTVTGKLFSASEFIAWYGAPRDGWIAPGCEVSDPDNYGARPILWAYDCETERGTRFVTGALLT